MGLQRTLFTLWALGSMITALPGTSYATVEANPLCNLEENLDPCIIQTKQIKIPGYPHAFNSSILQWEDGWLLSFRNKEKVNGVWHSSIGLVLLNADFEVKGDVQFLKTGSFRSADPRLIEVGDDIYIVYSDIPLKDSSSSPKLEMAVGKLGYDEEGRFFIHSISHITQYPDKTHRTEKNWVPFCVANKLFLAYSLEPHKIFTSLCDDSTYVLAAETKQELPWQWGEVRGGTPAILVDGKYLSFFHSCKPMKSIHSDGKTSRHYFMGAYLFDAEPPFTIEKMSPKPLIGRHFYVGEKYPSYWIAIQAIFPGGIAVKGPHLWVTYGRQDHEIWVAQIDKEKLLESLECVK